MKQLSLFKSPALFHGGTLNQGKRKSLRPLSHKRPIHLVLKCRKSILYSHKSFIEKESRRLEKKFSLKIYSLAVNHDHLHAVIKIKDRKSYVGFIRAFAGIMAKKLGKNLWSLMPFTRILSWGRDFRKVLKYLGRNRSEAADEVPYTPRKNYYRRHLKLSASSSLE